jgi:hypothetical protein
MDTAKNKIDVVIPYHEKDRDIVAMCVRGCSDNIENLGTIYVVSNNTDLHLDNITLIDEKEFFDNKLSKQYIESRWAKANPNFAYKAGWLLQQFIKMGCAYSIPNLSDYYLAVDADVVFLKPTRFFANNQMLFATSNEFHRPYFDCYERLLDEPPNRKWSFIAHHMLISKSIMLELIHNIEQRFGNKWYDAILDSIDYTQRSPFSEYETYGHYLKNHYPEKVVTRKPVCLQRLKLRHILMIILNRVDYVVLHSYKKISNNSSTLRLLRTIVDLRSPKKIRENIT